MILNALFIIAAIFVCIFCQLQMDVAMFVSACIMFVSGGVYYGLFAMHTFLDIPWINKICCKYFDWHKPYNDEVYCTGITYTSICKDCGKKIIAGEDMDFFVPKSKGGINYDK